MLSSNNTQQDDEAKFAETAGQGYIPDLEHVHRTLAKERLLQLSYANGQLEEKARYQELIDQHKEALFELEVQLKEAELDLSKINARIAAIDKTAQLLNDLHLEKSTRQMFGPNGSDI